jgi:hypothetical protein
MVGHRELPVRALDLNIGRRAGDPEDLVIIAFAVIAQKILFLAASSRFSNKSEGCVVFN